MPFKNNRNSRDDKSEKNKSPFSQSKKTRTSSVRPDKTNSTSDEKFGEKDSSFRRDSKKESSGRRTETKTGYKGAAADNKFGKKTYVRKSDTDGQAERTTRSRETNTKAEERSFKSRPGERTRTGERPSGSRSGDRPYGSRTSENSFTKKPAGERGNTSFKKDDEKRGSIRKPFNRDDNKSSDRYKKVERKWTSEERVSSGNRAKKSSTKADDGLIRLNRYIANAGICSRRKADDLIAAGVVSVNGQVTSELGLKVDPYKDEIRYNGQLLKREKMVYVLLNKPKDYITTTDDPQERRTVMHLVEKASKERIYPVGRLDRNTTGLLLMTNDGDLADKLSHPRNNITKIYQAELNKNLTQGDLNKIAFGLELEDGLIKPDVVSYVQGGTKREVGIQIHSGKNRIVRRIFEHLGYEVVKLDRVVYANLTKKDLPRGRWRYLEEKEIIQLKHLIQ